MFFIQKIHLAHILNCAPRAGVFLLAATSLSCIQVAHAQQASIILDVIPKENGLKLDTMGLSASEVEQDGKKTATWVSRRKSVPADEWARSFGLTFTDPAFKNGKAPVVDVEVTFWHSANTAVKVVADTTKGSREVASGWGNQNKLQTLKFRINDAYFGARKFSNDPKTLPSDGYDLRINAAAGDFHLRSVRVSVVDPNNVSDWTQFLQMGDAKSAKNWVLEPNASDDFSVDVKNSALQEAKGTARWEILDLGGKVIQNQDQPFVLSANASTPLKYHFDAKGLPTDEYTARLTLFVGNPDVPFWAHERSLMIADKEDVFILFDKEPIVHGMDFNRDGMQPVEIEVGGVKRWIWRGDATFGAEPWWRSAKLTVTDPRFTGGTRPVVDVRFTYRHAPNAPIEISGQGETGPRTIAQGWGNNPGWSTSSTHFDDAKWGAHTNSGNTNKRFPDGADLRISANSGPVELRSVRVRGYDLDVPNWRRLIRYDGLDAGRERYIFNPNEKTDIKIKLFNLSNKPFPAHAVLALRDDLGEPIWKREQDATLAPRKLGYVPVSLDATSLKQSVYLLNLEMGIGKTGDKLVQSEVNLMVSDQTPLPRAKKGEFLFGMDTGGGWHDDWLLGWTKFAGADVLRTSNASNEELPQALDKLQKLGIQTAHMVVPEWKDNADQRHQRTAELAARAAQVAAAHPEIVYYEIGNEPDLTYFYGGPPAAYVEDYITIYDAIKKANPQAVVANGGLCFAGEEGDARAREIIKLIPKDKIDAWAYHGHGPGAAAERNAYERIHAEAQKWGKSDIPFIETESGVAAGTLVQQRMQARTVIQKFTYAQSVGLPEFIWFRVFITGGDGGYTSIKNGEEPRSAILSYRTLVQQLRGTRFERKVDLGSSDYEGYLFVENGPHGEKNQTGKRRVLVAWANARGGGRRLLSLGNATNLHRSDMFGNISATEKASQIAGLTIDADPVFLKWDSDAAPGEVKVLPSLLEVAPTVYLAPHGQDSVNITVKNPSNTPLQTTLNVSADKTSGVQPPAPIPVQLAPGQSKTVAIALSVGAAPETLVWPRRWTVFANVPRDKVDLKALSSIPGKLEVGGTAVAPQLAVSNENRIDIAPLGGGFGERKEAILLAQVDSPRAQIVKIGASADWYMEWFVNGKLAFSTLEGGNAGAQSLTSHVFPIEIKAGKNLLAVRVQSGSQGWNFLSGGPQELAEALGTSSGAPTNRLTFTLQNAGQAEPLALESARIAFATRLAASVPDWNTPMAYAHLKPDAILGDAGVQNPFSIQPDSSRWWQGLNDLSGQLFLSSDAENLFVALQIRDDVAKSGDSARLALVSGEKSLDLKMESDGTLTRRVGNEWQKMMGLKVRRAEGPSASTWYFVSVPRSLLPGNRFAVNAVAIDDDFGVRKQWAPIADGFGDDLNLALVGRQASDWPVFVVAS